MLADKMKNGFQSQMTRTSAIVATALTLISSAFYVGQRVTHIEEAIYRIEDRQKKVNAVLEKVEDQINGHEKWAGHPELVEKIQDLKARVGKIEDQRR